ncbi:MAG: ParA family protein [Verrucomicrobiales bacterium]|nr:ParA family protein [Verrucomicrobiales bacterium]
MISLAITSQKGGVGKTTAAVNLAYSLARRGWHVLLIDTDPQGSVGLSLSEKARKCPGFYDAANSGALVLPMVLPTRLPELEILPAGQAHSFFRLLPEGVDGVATVRRVLDEVAQRHFDLVVFDTPAGLTGFSGDVLHVADFAVLPQQAEPLGLRSIPQILEALRHLRQKGARIELAGILLTMVQQESPEAQQIIREVRALLPGKLLLNTMVPRDPAFLKASSAGVPLGLLYRNPPAAALVFDQLAAELETRMRLNPPADETSEYTRLMD